jgi:hypothetical protein
VILAIGFAVFLLYAFPGYMSTDSIGQLGEARSGHFSDGNPPLMAAEWYLLDRIVAGPILMLLLQGCLFLGGLYVLLRRLFEPRHAAWCAIAILLFPPVLTPMAVIWKDSQMAAYIVAGLAAITQPSRRVRVLGIGLLAGACLMRHNALAAVVPIVGILFEWRRPIAWWKRIGIMIATAVLAFGALMAVNRVLATKHIRLTPVFHDILGTIAFSDDMSDDELRHILRGTHVAVDSHIQERARRTFAMRGAWRVLYGDDRLFEPPANEQEWDAFYRAWGELVRRQPTAYFAAHWDVFQSVLGIDQLPRAPVYNLFVEDPSQIAPVNHAATWSDSQAYIGRAFYWLADETPLFRPYVYACIALILLALACRDRLTLALFTSGLLYELSFMPAFAEPDYRYSHWMITTVCIACVFLFVQRRRRAKS